jgi:hypothetical protein
MSMEKAKGQGRFLLSEIGGWPPRHEPDFAAVHGRTRIEAAFVGGMASVEAKVWRPSAAFASLGNGPAAPASIGCLCVWSLKNFDEKGCSSARHVPHLR